MAELSKISSNTQQVLGLYTYQSTTKGDAIGDTRFSNQSGVFKVEVCTVANAVKGSGTWAKPKEWEIYFPIVLEEIEILHAGNTTITSVTLGNVATLQYSVNGGANWTTYSGSFTITATSSLWKVTAFSGAYTKGTIIIKATEL